MISDAEHLFMCLLAICMSFGYKNVSLGPLPILKIRLFFVIELLELFVYFLLLIMIRYMICKYILPYSRLPLGFDHGFLYCAESF